MDLNSPEFWRWVWVAMALIYLIGELLTPSAFFCLPPAFGAGLAGLLAFNGVDVSTQWLSFALATATTFVLLWPIGRRMDRGTGNGGDIGATRWLGQEARVVQAIAAHGWGTVRLAREVWRAESLTGIPVPVGTTVMVTRLAGTRLVVVPLDEARTSALSSRTEQPKEQQRWT